MIHANSSGIATKNRTVTDADTASAFQIAIPPDKIGEGTTYSVELVECAAAPAATGASTDTRFPAMGATPLMAKNTGTLRVTVIPLSSNAHMPDTSDKALQIYKDYLLAMYPVSKVEITVGKPMDVTALSEPERRGLARAAAEGPKIIDWKVKYRGTPYPTHLEQSGARDLWRGLLRPGSRSRSRVIRPRP